MLFFDYGGAYTYGNQGNSQIAGNRHPFSVFHGSVGGELWIDGVTGYFLQNNLRLGYARRLDADDPGYQTYAVLVAGF